MNEVNWNVDEDIFTRLIQTELLAIQRPSLSLILSAKAI